MAFVTCRHSAMMRTGPGRSAVLSKRSVFLMKILCFLFAVVWFCEFLVYYVVIIQCSWPKITGTLDQEHKSALKVIFLSDTHLLGAIRGHWFDKLRREWQMERSYQSALWLLQPDIVFILGDLFDEGKWSNSKAWDEDVERFHRMFRHPSHTELIVVVGNHDIGFHYEMTIHKLNRFERAFNLTSGEVLSRKGVNFVLVNSVALEGDNCVICRAAESQIFEVSRKLNCSRMTDDADLRKNCRGVERLPPSAPILLQHYPLYRESDSSCTGEDSASLEEKRVLFMEKYDVLSKDASEKLLRLLRPRLILSGHTHSACEVLHRGRIPEISVPSFSWRNRNNPSFIMGTITATEFALEKCFLPEENTVVWIYSLAGILVLLYLMDHLRTFTLLRTFSRAKHKPV
ncbi:metallophosphoesterase 1 [Spea bombifrons]|uniref:metallophosphoesterase 1 n=1 Tax=Spea bombifrons TaxID=233779 RepID=UPI00234AFB68|nr:metallophosphoesterase 1 [Spea bombifrons]